MPAVIVTEEMLADMGARPDLAIRYGPELAVLCHEHGVTTPRRLAHFLAQVYHESAKLTITTENLNYRADRLMEVFPKYYRTAAQARAHERQPMLIANRVYANRMGNGDEASGDGWRFRGRGLIQLTGRTNYLRFFAWMRLPPTFNPVDVGTTPRLAAASAVWFWVANRLNAVADGGTVEDVTRIVNGGLHGIDDRRKLYRRACEVLGV